MSTADDANTFSTIVLRDSAGDFAASTITATATQAQYADLAEIYTSDVDYTPGTVVMFGGDAEVTVSNEDASPRVAGVVSTNPAHLMNSGTTGIAIALTGRVPTHVVGAVRKGDMMVSTANWQSKGRV